MNGERPSDACGIEGNLVFNFSDIFCNFELDAAPTDDEKDLYELVAGVLGKGPRFLEILKTYTGQGAAISKV